MHILVILPVMGKRPVFRFRRMDRWLYLFHDNVVSDTVVVEARRPFSEAVTTDTRREASIVEATTMEALNWSDDGVLFNDEGADLATEVVQASVRPLQVGGTKRSSNLTRMDK
jgi:hypothetical protein